MTREFVAGVENLAEGRKIPVRAGIA